jgi:hypothetical protein
MKKLMILLAVTCLVCVSCGPKKVAEPQVAEENCCTLTPEQEEMFATWELWAELPEDQQIAVVADMKLFLDECKAKCEAKCQEKEGEEEVCPEKAAKCAEFKARWEAFETLSLEEQKAIIDEVLAHKAECCKDKEEACEETCAKE